MITKVDESYVINKISFDTNLMSLFAGESSSDVMKVFITRARSVDCITNWIVMAWSGDTKSMDTRATQRFKWLIRADQLHELD